MSTDGSRLFVSRPSTLTMLLLALLLSVLLPPMSRTIFIDAPATLLDATFDLDLTLVVKLRLASACSRRSA